MRKEFLYDSHLEEAEIGILESMTEDERDEMAQPEDEKGTFFEKVVVFRGLARGYDVSERVGKVVEPLGGV